MSATVKAGRIVWTDEEKADLVAKACDLIEQDADLEPIVALEEAQIAVMVGDKRSRRREIRDMERFKEWYPDMLRDEAEKRGFVIQGLPPKPAPKLPDPPPIPDTSIGSAYIPPAPLVRPDDLSFATDGDLWAELCKRQMAALQPRFEQYVSLALEAIKTDALVEVGQLREEVGKLRADIHTQETLTLEAEERSKRLEARLDDEVAKVFAAATDKAEQNGTAAPHHSRISLPPAPKSAPKRLPRIFVASLHPKEASEFQRHYKGRAELVTPRQGGHGHLNVLTCDYYLVNKRFAGKDAVKDVKDFVGPKGEHRLTILDNGVTAMYEAINAMVAEWESGRVS